MPVRNPTTGPLLGLRILDLTRLLPGPLGTMLMADMGADVIKIELPNAPDYVRAFPPYINGESANYMAYNRSKRSIFLDYQTPDGQTQFLELVKTADVVVEQFRPGHLDRLGIGYAAARAVNPRIIYVSVTGYGQTGPYAHLAGHDLNYIALAGVLGLTGTDPTDAPVIPGVQVADIAGGSYGCVMGTLAALYARERTGEGQHVDVSMTDAVMPLLSVAYATYAGGLPTERGQMPLAGGLPNYGIYQCRDGKYVALGTLEPKFWQKFCTLVDKPDWLGFILPQNPAQLAAFKAIIQELFVEKDRADWVRFGLESDMLITPVNELADLETDPHLSARQMVVTQQHPVAGPFQSIGVPLKFSTTPAQPAWPAPKPGEDTSGVLGHSLGK
ncbi:CaiB/BaiF CoA transferase family protein [Spirosoma montaniterrae]|uniref:Carnitine dehydratase n=1 Tax=Spirosoma montaniterrae TaxID=1178516 RepID=A0A1P9WX55_9BACT|nr:CoA transferase [Spirosoma montaniterrae]AQG79949.1 carnitine dehydratase [Spirosoma montaniterrae]